MSGINIKHWKIIVKFTRIVTKEHFYKAHKHLKNKASDIGLASTNKKFTLESPTTKNRELFNECSQFKQNHYFKFIWARSGRVYLRNMVAEM